MGEPISPNNMAVAQPLIEVFGEIPIRKIFSRTWNLREEGVAEIEDLIMQGRRKDQTEVFLASITVIKVTISDKIIGVCQRSIQFLINLCNSLPNVKIPDRQSRELQISADSILYSLIEKLGDNLQKIR
jgi:hypothetical protein